MPWSARQTILSGQEGLRQVLAGEDDLQSNHTLTDTTTKRCYHEHYERRNLNDFAPENIRHPRNDDRES